MEQNKIPRQRCKINMKWEYIITATICILVGTIGLAIALDPNTSSKDIYGFGMATGVFATLAGFFIGIGLHKEVKE